MQENYAFRTLPVLFMIELPERYSFDFLTLKKEKRLCG